MRIDLAAVLALVMLTPGPALASEKCLARSIDKAGRCNGRPFAKAAFDAQIRGVPAKPERPEGVDADELATKLAGGLSTGEWHAVAGGPPLERGQSEWVLVVRRAQVGAAPEHRLSAVDGDDNVALIALLRVTAASTVTVAGKPRVTVLASRESLVDGTGAGPKPAEASSAIIPCIDPAGSATGEDADAGQYPEIADSFRWITLSPRHRVLAAAVSRNEGYAGGGGTFTADILLDVRDHALQPIACYATSRYQMFGGDWNADGTRQHPESQAGWRLQPGGTGAWPLLRLTPTTRTTPGATLTWDAARGFYK